MIAASRLLVFAFIIFICKGCLDSIELSLPDSGGGRVVIDGVITQSDSIYEFKVSVSRTVSTSDVVAGDLVETQIKLFMDGQAVLNLQNGASHFEVIERFHEQNGGAPFHSLFNIQVVLDNDSYESEQINIPKSPPAGELSVQLIERSELNDIGRILVNEYVELRINGTLLNDLNERVSLLWEVSGVYEFQEIPWTDNPFFIPKTCYVQVAGRNDEINLISSDQVNGNTFEGVMITETQADHRFYSGYLYTVVQRSLDASATQYWQQIKSAIEREGTIFDVPPGSVDTNIEPRTTGAPEVLGYFYGTSVDTLHKLATRKETGEQSHLCRFQILESPCCSCLDLLFSSLEKPPYWE